MNQQSKKFFVRHGDNEFTYYGSHMSMHMGSGAILVHNEVGEIVGAHNEWDCAYEIQKPDLTKNEFSVDLDRNPYSIVGLTASEIYMKMQKERNHFANTMLDSIVTGETASDAPVKIDKSNGINWFAVAAFCMFLFAAYHLYKTL